MVYNWRSNVRNILIKNFIGDWVRLVDTKGGLAEIRVLGRLRSTYCVITLLEDVFLGSRYLTSC